MGVSQMLNMPFSELQAHTVAEYTLVGATGTAQVLNIAE
jgi:hypothetical protein